ncbi:MAG: hypothetical protein JNL57_07145 [Bacteroidetes bacterium]|nr:hypothetical protein [Bacteroidota bacterium]
MDFKTRLPFLLLWVCSLQAMAQSGQNFTASPYSNFGLGEVLNNNFTQAGYSSQSHSGAYSYSLLNPATLGNLQYTTLDFGLSARTGSVQSGSNVQGFRGGSLNYLAMGYKSWHTALKIRPKSNADSTKRIKKLPLEWNSAFALYPSTSVGYNYVFESQNPIKTLTAHSGIGGINVVDWAHGLRIGNHVSFGYSLGYMFGQLTDNSIFSFPDSAEYNFVGDEKRVLLRGYQHRAGGLFQFRMDSTYHKLGFSFGFHSGMKGNQSRLTRTLEYSSGGSLYAIDTVVLSETGYQKFKMPSSLGLGYTFQWRRKWSLGLDYRFTRWGNYSAFFSHTSQMANRSDFGFTFILNPADEKLSKQKHQPIPIRLGARYSQTQNVFTSSGVKTTIEEQGAFFGFGLPLTRRYFDNRVLRSVINVQIDYITRGKNSNGLAREQYVGATVGLNLGDIWFVRRKFGD